MKRASLWEKILICVYWVLAHIFAVAWVVSPVFPFEDTTLQILCSIALVFGGCLIPYLLWKRYTELEELCKRKIKNPTQEAIRQSIRAAEEAGRQKGHADGYAKGRGEGYARGRKDGYASGLIDGADRAGVNSEAAPQQASGNSYDQGLSEGQETGYSLGHSEGYKYALYSQGRFQYYTGEPPLTYEDAKASLVDGKNGDLLKQKGFIYDKDGYNAKGFNWLGYDREGSDASGRDKAGFDREGYDWQGFNRQGFDREGYDWEGYNKEGYNREGYNREGVNREGHGRAPEPTAADHVEPNDEELDRLFQEVKENYESNGFKLNTSDGCEYDAARIDRSGLNRNGFSLDGLDSNGRFPYRAPDKPATEMMSRLRREGLQGDPYLWEAPDDEDDAEEIARSNYEERPTEEAALSRIE